MKTIWIDLLLLNGEIVRIEGKSRNEDEILNTIENAMKRRDWWSVRQWEGTSATLLGVPVDRVNMGQVAAML